MYGTFSEDCLLVVRRHVVYHAMFDDGVIHLVVAIESERESDRVRAREIACERVRECERE
jgi:hypothetical protein